MIYDLIASCVVAVCLGAVYFITTMATIMGAMDLLNGDHDTGFLLSFIGINMFVILLPVTWMFVRRLHFHPIKDKIKRD